MAQISTIYYLHWHQSDPMEDTAASALFHRFHHDPLDSLPASTLQELYEEVADTETEDFEQIY